MADEGHHRGVRLQDSRLEATRKLEDRRPEAVHREDQLLEVRRGCLGGSFAVMRFVICMLRLMSLLVRQEHLQDGGRRQELRLDEVRHPEPRQEEDRHREVHRLGCHREEAHRQV